MPLRALINRRQLLALIAGCALLFSAALYAGHGLDAREHGHQHCDLCVHLSGAAGSPPTAKVIVPAAFLARLSARPAASLLAARFPAGISLARGPPPGT